MLWTVDKNGAQDRYGNRIDFCDFDRVITVYSRPSATRFKVWGVHFSKQDARNAVKSLVNQLNKEARHVEEIS